MHWNSYYKVPQYEIYELEQCQIQAINLDTNEVINVSGIEDYGTTLGYISGLKAYTMKPEYTRNYVIDIVSTTEDGYFYNDYLVDSGFTPITGSGELREWSLSSDTGSSISWILNKEGFVYDTNENKILFDNTIPDENGYTYAEEIKESFLIVGRATVL